MVNAELLSYDRDEKGEITDYSIRLTSGKKKGTYIRMAKNVFEQFVKDGKVDVKGYPVDQPAKRSKPMSSKIKAKSPDDF